MDCGFESYMGSACRGLSLCFPRGSSRGLMGSADLDVTLHLRVSTTFHPTPIPWREFPAECLLYFVGMGILQLAVFVIGCLVLAVLARKQPGTFLRRVGHFGLFSVLLLVVGSLFNGLWSCLMWDRLYHSTDYFIDFTPFWPITKNVIDAAWGDDHGQLLGVSLLQLNCVWLLFAVGAWSATIFLYRLVSRHTQSKVAFEIKATGA